MAKVLAGRTGIVSGSSNLDPSAVVTATVIGAAYSYSLLWVVVLCIPFLWALFSVTARIGVETRKGVLDLVRESYGKPLALVGAGITIVINLCVVVADMMAVSEAFSIILGVVRLYFVAAIAFSVWYILIFRDYRKITLALVIVLLPLYIYVASAVITGPPLGELIRNMFTPHFGTNSQMIQALWRCSGRSSRPISCSGRRVREPIRSTNRTGSTRTPRRW